MAHVLPDGEGVIDRKASTGKVIAFYGSLVGAGALGMLGLLSLLQHDAQAAGVRPPSIEQSVSQIAADVGTLKADMKAVKCRLNIEGTCPPEYPSGGKGH